MLNEEIGLSGSGTCYGEGARAVYFWTERGWSVMYASDSGKPLGRSSDSGHPSLALLGEKHEAAVIEVAMAWLEELDFG
jgi:hypothetical protein